MKNISLFMLSSILATGAFAQSHTTPGQPEAQAPGSRKAQAAAEAIHTTKPHGIGNTPTQPEAQAPGSPKAQAAAETKKNAKPSGSNVVRSIPLEDGSTVLVFKDGKMGMEDKSGRSTRMKPGQVMKAKDGTRLMMVGDEVMRVESLQAEKKGGGSN